MRKSECQTRHCSKQDAKQVFHLKNITLQNVVYTLTHSPFREKRNKICIPRLLVQKIKNKVKQTILQNARPRSLFSSIMQFSSLFFDIFICTTRKMRGEIETPPLSPVHHAVAKPLPPPLRPQVFKKKVRPSL